ncbi:MAG: PIN domain-containing protein [Thermoanaerobaculia bacterium]|nr:PIN domain-containing protein [Thermoanaerobaculia bacterium]
MVALLDVNFLVALAWPNHVHHTAALAWFERHHGEGWATCSVTQSGFVRVSSNKAVLPEAKTPHEALFLLRRIVALPHHVFWVDDVSLASSEHVDASRLLGYRQVTDAHLLALALRHGGRLATLDAGVRELVPRGRDRTEVVALVGAGEGG